MSEPNETPNSPEPGADPIAETPPTPPTPDDAAAPKSLIEEAPAAPPAEFVPLTAEDIVFPEGAEINSELRDEALTIFNDRELSPKEQLQRLFDLQLRSSLQASEAVTAAWDKTQADWQNEVKADATIGGANLTATLGRVNKLVAEFGDSNTVEAFAITGAGNNPAIIRLLNNVALKLTEPGAHVSGQPKASEMSRAERMYPSMKGNNG